MNRGAQIQEGVGRAVPRAPVALQILLTNSGLGTARPATTRPALLSFLVLIVLLAAGLDAAAQARYRRMYQEPDWFTFHLTEVSAGIYAEGTFDQTSYKNSDTTISHEHLFMGPSVGLSFDGSVYHPNLLRYQVNSEGAFGWGYDHVTGSTSREELQYLGRFAGAIDLLSGKPYHATAFANYDHTFRDNDFFSRVTVDSWRYGARASWESGPWSVSVDYTHRDETSTSPFPITRTINVTNVVSGTNVVTVRTNQGSIDQNNVTHDDNANFTARNERSAGGTTFNYAWSHYNRVDVGGRVGEGNDHSVSLADGERFGDHERYKLNTTASYYRRDALDEQSEEIVAYSSLSAEHRPTLTSYYDLNYDHFNTGSFDSSSYSGQASLTHQLYDSLISSVNVHGSDYELSDNGNSGYSRRYGAGFSESYVKNLPGPNRLRISQALVLDHTDQQNLGIVKNERHSFSEAGAPPDSFFLAFPNVIQATIVVTDTLNSQPSFLENFDYRVTQLGSRTLIERLTGSRIPVNGTVLVDYRALPTPEGHYETVTESFQIRVELWQNLVGLYTRVNLSLNNAPPGLRVQDVTAYTFGADLTWRWIRAGAEYEVYDSTESDYQAARLFQSFAFHPDEASNLSIDFTESWVDYTSAHRQEQAFQAITRYHRRLSRRFGLDAEAGVSFRRGAGVDQTLATVRPSLKYVIGKTVIDAGYDYEYELFLNNEERHKQMFFLRVKRIF